MRAGDLLSLSTRMFRTRPTRTWLTVLGISVGISAVLFLVSLGYGLQNVILNKIVFSQALLSLSVSPGNEILALDQSMIEEFVNIPNVTNVEPLASSVGQISLDNINGTVELRGVNAGFFDFAGVSAVAGNLYTSEESGQVVVSEAILKLFDVTDPATALGKELGLKIFVPVKIEGQNSVEIIDVVEKFKIKGVVKDSQDSYVYLSLADLSKHIKIEKYDGAQVKVNQSKNLEAVKSVVLDKGFQVQSLSETIEQANKIFQVVQIVLGLFGAVALVVSSIGMFNTMTVTLLERTNEIGIMRALGASKGNLKSLFLAESIVIGFLGGVMGILIGIGGGTLFNWVINSMASRFGGAKTSLFAYPNWFLLGIIIISIVIGFLSGVFPARKASNMNPLEALRYK